MTMKVNTAQGREDVANPLVGFTFPQDALQGQYGQFQPSPRERITRCPSPNKYPDTANQQLQSSNLKELVVRGNPILSGRIRTASDRHSTTLSSTPRPLRTFLPQADLEPASNKRITRYISQGLAGSNLAILHTPVSTPSCWFLHLSWLGSELISILACFIIPTSIASGPFGKPRTRTRVSSLNPTEVTLDIRLPMAPSFATARLWPPSFAVAGILTRPSLCRQLPNWDTRMRA